MSEAPKRRGRPAGSKNKPKGVPMQQGAVASIDDIFADDDPVSAVPQSTETAAPPDPVVDPVADLEAPAVVRIRCTTTRGPWTDKKSLKFGEEAEVSREIAAVLVDREYAEYV